MQALTKWEKCAPLDKKLQCKTEIYVLTLLSIKRTDSVESGKDMSK